MLTIGDKIKIGSDTMQRIALEMTANSPTVPVISLANQGMVTTLSESPGRMILRHWPLPSTSTQGWEI
jgi:hypothetical protein